MINYHDFLECIDNSPQTIEKFGWNCYGDDAYSAEYWNKKHDNESVSIEAIFDIRTHLVYEIKIYDSIHNREYIWIDPHFRHGRLEEYELHSINPMQGIILGQVTELEVEDDVLNKVNGAFLEQDYNTSIMISVEIEAELEKTLRCMAEEQNITFDKLIEQAIKKDLEQRIKK